VAKTIRMTIGNVSLEAVLNDTETAKAIWNVLPFEVRANTWGTEIYFEIPLKMGLEKAQEDLERGDLGYWPTGQAFCIFLGPTPASQGQEIRPVSAVTVFGRILSDISVLGSISPGTRINVERVGEN
jgi:uncharacterized protein